MTLNYIAVFKTSLETTMALPLIPVRLLRMSLIFQRLHGRSQYPGTASVWRSPRRSWSAMLAASGWSPNPAREARSISHCREGAGLPCMTRSLVAVQILLVEDNPGDVRLAVEALRDTDSLQPAAHRPRWGRGHVTSCAGRASMWAFHGRISSLLDLKFTPEGRSGGLGRNQARCDLKRIPVVIFTSSAAEQDNITRLQPVRQLLHHQATGSGAISESHPVDRRFLVRCGQIATGIIMGCKGSRFMCRFPRQRAQQRRGEKWPRDS